MRRRLDSQPSRAVSRCRRLLFNVALLAIVACGLASGACPAPPLLGAVRTQPTPQELYFPPVAETWLSASPAEVDWDAAALARVLTFAREHRSTALVMLHRGRILAEEYWTVPVAARPTADASGRPVEDVASVQKSVVAALIGIAIERKLMDLDAPAARYLGPGWSKASTAQEGAITVRHLMSMTSGLDESLAYAYPPGQRWFYNTPAYSTLITALARASGHPPNLYTAEWLMARIGAVDTRWIERAPGGPNPYGLATTARDLARFGLLMLAEGRWRETTIVPRAYLRDEVLRPSQTLNPSYGLLWWVNGSDGWEDWTHGGRQRGRFIPTAPADSIAARGAGDRRLYVVPSLGLVVSRLGAPVRGVGTAADTQFFDRELWRLIMEAAPKR